ncbi:carph-isopro domain-containing protein [Komagataeibacter europaeus]|uniref:carph-isopro domain-containing protein n=1 Tax=Komagataeibacter europaeus TaxID=33995 RepID=UPI0038CDA545
MANRSIPDADNVAASVVSAFGGLTKATKALGHRTHSTIYSWVRKGRIPHWRHAEIVRAADREGVEIPNDLFRGVKVVRPEGEGAR